jgi:hypothetical protein
MPASRPPPLPARPGVPAPPGLASTVAALKRCDEEKTILQKKYKLLKKKSKARIGVYTESV